MEFDCVAQRVVSSVGCDYPEMITRSGRSE